MLTAAEVDAVRLSLSIALRSVLFSLPLAVAVAWLLTRRALRGRLLLDALVHLPLVLPPVVVGYLLLLLFGMRGPIGGWLYEHFGIQLVFTSAGAALATAVMSFPLMVRAIRISLEGIDGGHLLAARSAGSLLFYDWDTGHVVRRIEIAAKRVFWSENGDMVAIAGEDSLYILKYNAEAVANANVHEIGRAHV